MARAVKAMATVMRVAGNKEGDGKGRKGNGNGDKVCRSKIVRTIRIFKDRNLSIDGNAI
jgi:hypothetical protein